MDIKKGWGGKSAVSHDSTAQVTFGLKAIWPFIPRQTRSLQARTQSHIYYKPQTACTTLFNVSMMQNTDLSGNSSLVITAVLSPMVLFICHMQKCLWSPRAGEKEDQSQAPLHRSQKGICHNPVFHLLPWSTEQMRKERKLWLNSVCN